jgi:hypothetical protein
MAIIDPAQVWMKRYFYEPDNPRSWR